MNSFKTLLVAVVSTLAASGAMAAEATSDRWISDAKSVLSRQAVASEAAAARASGAIEFGEASSRNFTRGFEAKSSRADVAAQAAQARRAGLTRGGEA